VHCVGDRLYHGQAYRVEMSTHSVSKLRLWVYHVAEGNLPAVLPLLSGRWKGALLCRRAKSRN
jgi:hypothetical protein